MFEEYIEKNINGILENFNLNQDKIYIDEIISKIEISNFYKAFALAELDWWILCDDENKSKSQNFDYSSIEVQSNLMELEAKLRQKAFFTIDDFKSFIGFAVKSRINFLCRPQFTLTQFCFSSSYEESIKVLIKKIAYFSDYKYFNTSFSSKIEELGYNNDTIISKEDFENLIEEIDYDNILNLSSKEFVELVNPIYNFFNIVESENQEQLVPSEALLIFFDDKSINPIVLSLQKKYESPEFKFINRTVLHNFIIQMIEATESGEIEEEIESVFENNSDIHDEIIGSIDSVFDEIENDLENELNVESNLIENKELIQTELIDTNSDFTVKEYEVFDLLDASEELIEKEDDLSNLDNNELNSFVDIDKFNLESEEKDLEFEFNEIETLLETQKEEEEEIENEKISNNEFLNEFNLLIEEIDNSDISKESQDAIIDIFDDKQSGFEKDSSILGSVLNDDIEEVLDININSDENLENNEINVLNEATLLLQNFNKKQEEIDLDDIGALLDDISKVNNS